MDDNDDGDIGDDDDNDDGDIAAIQKSTILQSYAQYDYLSFMIFFYRSR